MLLLCEGNALKYGHARRADDAEGLLALSFGARADDADAAARGGVPAGERLAALAFNARGDACVVSFATLQGAQAAAIALDGAAFEGVRCAAHFGRDETSPACVLANCVDEPETLDELSKVELIGDFEEVCEAFGTVTSIVVDARGVGPRGRKTQRKERGSLVRLSPPRLRPDASKS